MTKGRTKRGSSPPAFRVSDTFPYRQPKGDGGAPVYCLTTTIDEQGMADLINEAAARVNAPMRKRQPFGIVRTEEPIDPEAMPAVMVSTFYLVLVGDCGANGAKQAADFVEAMNAAADEVRRMNEANYILAHIPRRIPPAK